MERALTWLTAGPGAGSFRHLPVGDAERAEAEGWGQIVRPGWRAQRPRHGEPHAEAEAYFAAGYNRRDMVAGSPPAAVPLRETPELPAAMLPHDERPAGKPRGRPRKIKS